MPRETTADKIARTKKIISALERTYPDAHCELNFSNPLELLVATILSAQCTDKRVNIVTANLFKKYRAARDFAEAKLAEMENDVRSTGFYRNKAKNIKSACADMVDKIRRRRAAHHGRTASRSPASGAKQRTWCWETLLASTSAWWWTRTSRGCRTGLA